MTESAMRTSHFPRGIERQLASSGIIAAVFALGACGYDLDPPRIDRVEAQTQSGQRLNAPLNNGSETYFDPRNIPASVTFLITFSEQMDPQSIQDHIAVYNGDQKATAPINYMLVANVLYLRPAGGLFTGAKNYYIDIKPGIKDTSGNETSQKYHVNFYADAP